MLYEFSNSTHTIVAEVEFHDYKRAVRDIDLQPALEISRLSITGTMFRRNDEYRRGGGICCGQIYDKLAKFNHYLVKHFAELWERWHLNDMRSGCRIQQAAVGQWCAANEKIDPDWRYDYDAACRMLQERGIYEVDGYRYGHQWLYEPLPDHVKTALQLIPCELEVS